MIFKPRLIDSLKKYSLQLFISDVFAGIIVGIIAIPLAIAFAIASGVGPEKGLFTAIIAGFIISALGGSSVQIGGPTGAFIVIVYGIIEKYGINGLIISTAIAGIILIILGLLKAGTLIQYIPYPVIVGFTSGIALVIFSSQINDLLGLSLTNIPGDFIDKWILYIKNISHINFYALSISLFTIIIIVLWRKVTNKIPGSIIALIITTLIVSIFNLPVETIGDRFGELPSSLPSPILPNLNLETFKNLINPAISIALLAAIESLLSAVVADGMVGERHDSNTELIAQGIANIASSLFGGLPATGAIARTTANINNGAKTPVAGMTHAITLLLILIFFGKLAIHIPLACLAGILVVISYNMSEFRSFRDILAFSRTDSLVLITTFLLTVILDLTIAIQIGMIMSLFLFMKRMSDMSKVEVIQGKFSHETESTDPFAISVRHIPDGVEVYEASGAFFFGSVEKFRNHILSSLKAPKIRILRMRNIIDIDATGIKLLKQVYHDTKKKGSELILSGVERPNIIEALKNSGLYEMIGKDNILPNIDLALERAEEMLGIKKNTMLVAFKNGGAYYDIEGTNSLEAIKNAIEKMKEIPHIDKKTILHAIIQREELMSTGIGKGIAIPHPRNPILKEKDLEYLFIFFLKNPVDFHSMDDKPVNIMFIPLCNSQKTHLEMLSKIATYCNNDEFYRLINNKPSEDDIKKFIENNRLK